VQKIGDGKIKTSVDGLYPKCTKNCFKRTIVVQLIVEDIFGTQCISVLAPIMSDSSDHSDTSLLSSKQCQQQIRQNDRKNTLEQYTKQNHNLSTNKHTVMRLKLLGS